MTKTLILLLSLLTFSTFTVNAQDNWKTYKIDDAVSVKLPGAAIHLNGHDIYLKETDSTAYYVYVEDFSDMTNLSGDELAAKEKTRELADAVKDDLGSRMPGYTLGNVTIGKWKDYTCYHFSGGNAKNKSDLYVFVVFVGINGYYLVTTLPANHSAAKKDIFFDSVNQ